MVLLSSILNFGLDYGNGEPNANGDWPYVLYLPTEAATAWYHNKIRNKPASERVTLRDVEHFAMGDYLDALYAGNHTRHRASATPSRRALSYLSGHSRVVRAADRICAFRTIAIQRELLRGQDVVFGRLDSRYTTYGLHKASNRRAAVGSDGFVHRRAVHDGDQSRICATICSTKRRCSTAPNIYDIIYSNGSSWDFTHNRRSRTNVAPDLADAMTQNPSLKVFSANGYYDFATPFFATVYTLQHLEIAPRCDSNITLRLLSVGTHGVLERHGARRNSNPISRAGMTALRDAKRMKHTLKRVLALLDGGRSLADSARRHARSLPPATPDGVSHHVNHVDGQSIPYTARAGTITLRNDKDQITARMFYVAYTKDGANPAQTPGHVLL